MTCQKEEFTLHRVRKSSCSCLQHRLPLLRVSLNNKKKTQKTPQSWKNFYGFTLEYGVTAGLCFLISSHTHTLKLATAYPDSITPS